METTLSQKVKRLMAAVVRVSPTANGANGHRRQLRLFAVQDAAEILDMPPSYFAGRVDRGEMEGLWINGMCHVSVQDVAVAARVKRRKRRGFEEVMRITEEHDFHELDDLA